LIRIGNASGFYGDRFSAVREMLEGGALDFLTGDYLAELTMMILGRERARGGRGFARTFLSQMEQCLAIAAEKRVKIVTNAGGLDPAGLAAELRALATRLGVNVAVAHVEGDDLLPRAAELGLGTPITANAYLGAWGIAECLRGGADVVVTGRVTDASLVVGPAAAAFDWKHDDWDRLAGATVAGHVLECGTQSTGGNFAFFREIDLAHPAGFPIAEIDEDGSFVVTKHPGTGGAVTIETVTAQLLYEITGARYPGPDVTTRFDSIALAAAGADRVRVAGVRGEPPPPTVKVSRTRVDGFRNEATLILVGLDIEEKAKLARAQLEAALAKKPARMRFVLARSDRDDADTEQGASALLRVIVSDHDADVVGRSFSRAAVELALGSYPGFTTTSPPRDATPLPVSDAAYVDARSIAQVAVLPDGTRRAVDPPPATLALSPAAEPPLPPPPAALPTTRVPLGRIAGARSGDKGGTANLGVWARDDASYRFLVHMLTIEKLRELLPETAAFPIERHVFPLLRGMNFVVDGLLGEGAASSSRFDPQAKALGEWLRSRIVEVPASLQ
jgi:hypothetical protein